MPILYTEEALDVVARNVGIAQDALGRPLMVENPSSYLRFVDSTMPECEFVAEIARRAGCGILLDLNNIHVSAHNHGFAVADYLKAIPGAVIGEFHLAGHAISEVEGTPILIDDHALGRCLSGDRYRAHLLGAARARPRGALGRASRCSLSRW